MRDEVFTLLVVLCSLNLLVCVLIIVKFVMEYSQRKEIQSTLTAIRGNVVVSESQLGRMINAIIDIKMEHEATRIASQEAIVTAAKDVKRVVEQVPERVVEKIQEVGDSNIMKKPNGGT